jgi:hypothetical protein
VKLGSELLPDQLGSELLPATAPVKAPFWGPTVWTVFGFLSNTQQTLKTTSQQNSGQTRRANTEKLHPSQNNTNAQWTKLGRDKFINPMA